MTTPQPQTSILGDQDIRTVLMDPPWNESGGGKIKRGADRWYPLLKTDQMPPVIRGCEHWPRLCDDGHLYMWVTNSFLEDGLWLMGALGYRYITNLVWAKEQMGIGQYFRGQHELLIFGVRGDVYIPTEGTWPTLLGGDLLDHPRENGKRIHSRKPPEAHEMIEAASPGKRLELFARDEREGWITWGNEVGE